MGQFVTSFGKGFTVLEKELEKDLTNEEKVRNVSPYLNSSLLIKAVTMLEQELEKNLTNEQKARTNFPLICISIILRASQCVMEKDLTSESAQLCYWSQTMQRMITGSSGHHICLLSADSLGSAGGPTSQRDHVITHMRGDNAVARGLNPLMELLFDHHRSSSGSWRWLKYLSGIKKLLRKCLKADKQCLLHMTGDPAGAGGGGEVPVRGGEVVRDGARVAAALQVAAVVWQPQHRPQQRLSGGSAAGQFAAAASLHTILAGPVC